jgi:hypothetical protein
MPFTSRRDGHQSSGQSGIENNQPNTPPGVFGLTVLLFDRWGKQSTSSK